MLKIVGHRGAAGLAPENTIAAIKKALEHGVDEIEIDVRVSRDNVVFVHHNQFLRDQSGIRLNVRSHDFKELLRHKPDLPTLEEVVREINRKVPLQIEVKWGENTKPIIAILKKLLAKGWQPTDFYFGSKKQRTLVELHQALPSIPIIIIEPFLSVRGRWRAKQLGSKRLSMNALGLWGGFIRATHHGGYELYAYHLDDPAKAQRWQRQGLSGVITDYPDNFQA